MTDPATVATAVRDAVRAVPGVAGLTSGGNGVQVGTQYPGGTVPGVRLGDPVEVHVVVDRLPIAPVAERVRAAARAALARFGPVRPVEVVVVDLVPAEPDRVDDPDRAVRAGAASGG